LFYQGKYKHIVPKTPLTGEEQKKLSRRKALSLLVGMANTLPGKESLFICLFQHSDDPLFVHHTDSVGRYLEGDIAILFRDIKLFHLQIGQEPSSGFVIGMRHMVPGHHTFSG